MDEETPPAPAQAKPSKVPSWVALGFVAGALFVAALPRGVPPEAGPRPSATAPEPRPASVPKITTIEAVFAAWGKYAVWSDDTAEVALWSTETMSYSDCYEVLRVGDAYYFRSIPALTRPILTHGVVEESPLKFTETVRQREEWLAEVDRENLKALSEAARQSFGPAAPVPQK